MEKRIADSFYPLVLVSISAEKEVIMSFYTQTETTRNELLGLNIDGVSMTQVKIGKDNCLDVNADGLRLRYAITDWDAESYGILESLLHGYMKDAKNKGYYKTMLLSYGKSPCDAHALEGAWVGGDEKSQKKTYCKASKVRGKQEIDKTIIAGLIYDLGFRIDLLKQLASFDFKKTSAVLYKGIYVCPVSVEYELMKVLGISKAEAKEMVSQFLRGE